MSSTSLTSFPQFLSLPFTALRKVIRHAALDDLGKLMFDRQLAEYIYSLKVWAGAYCISFTGSAGVQVPLKTFDWTFDGPIEDTIQTVMEVYENLSSRFPGFLDTLVIDPFYMGMPDFPEFKQCNRLE